MLLFDEENLEKRKAVWAALSDLFLDTDVSLNYEYIAGICAESSFTLEELKEILENEVAPVCSKNLLSIAGEWSGFDEEWLESNIKKGIQARQGMFKKLLKPLKNIGFNTYIEHHWKKLESIIIEKRKAA